MNENENTDGDSSKERHHLEMVTSKIPEVINTHSPQSETRKKVPSSSDTLSMASEQSAAAESQTLAALQTQSYAATQQPEYHAPRKRGRPRKIQNNSELNVDSKRQKLLAVTEIKSQQASEIIVQVEAASSDDFNPNNTSQSKISEKGKLTGVSAEKMLDEEKGFAVGTSSHSKANVTKYKKAGLAAEEISDSKDMKKKEEIEGKSGWRSTGKKEKARGDLGGTSEKASPRQRLFQTKEENQLFSPRRSGRGVIPNRRFQDMELDFGRKKSKIEMPDEPSSEEKPAEKNLKIKKSSRVLVSQEPYKQSKTPKKCSADKMKQETENALLSDSAIKSFVLSNFHTSKVQSPQRTTVDTATSLPDVENSVNKSPISSTTPVSLSAVFSEPSNTVSLGDTDAVSFNLKTSLRSLSHSAATTAPTVLPSSHGDSDKPLTLTHDASLNKSHSVEKVLLAGHLDRPLVASVVCPDKAAEMDMESQSGVEDIEAGSLSTATDSPAKMIKSQQQKALHTFKNSGGHVVNVTCRSSVIGTGVKSAAVDVPKQGVVMSIVELSPNKKVPVIIAERKQTGTFVRVKIAPTSQPVLQIAPAQGLLSPQVATDHVLSSQHQASGHEQVSSGHQQSSQLPVHVLNTSSLHHASTSQPTIAEQVSTCRSVSTSQQLTEQTPAAAESHYLLVHQSTAAIQQESLSQLGSEPEQAVLQHNQSVSAQPLVEARNLPLPKALSEQQQDMSDNNVSLEQGGQETLKHPVADDLLILSTDLSETESVVKGAESLSKKSILETGLAVTKETSSIATSTDSSDSSNDAALVTTLRRNNKQKDSLMSYNHNLSSSSDEKYETVSMSVLTDEGGQQVFTLDNAAEEELIQGADGKFATSGTQTPYNLKSTTDGKKVITVRVQPPPPRQQTPSSATMASFSVVKKEIEDEEDDDAQFLTEDEMEESCNSDSGMAKREYIVVNLPEGTTIKQQYVPSRERLEDDPTFYTVDEKGNYNCHICRYKTSRKANFYKHKRKHLGIRPHRCEVCDYRAATSSNLKRHMAIHEDLRNYKCVICGLNFRQKIHLERHIKYKHEEKKVKCPLCDYVCANENPDLKVHIRRKHMPHTDREGAMDAYTCQECGLVAMSKRDLRQHAKFHTKGPELKLFCQQCSFVTDCESRLRRHMFIHTKEKPFQCGLCDYRGSQKEHVLRHMRSQHNIEIVRKHRVKKNSHDKTGSSGDEARVLDKADYSSEEKIFACNHCTMKFAKLINLYKHLHTQHKDIMPADDQTDFCCVVCDFRTTNKKNLLVHMRKHNTTDQSPPSHVYSCVLCRYMNPKRRNLFQHMRKKHHIEIVIGDDGTTTCYVANDSPGSIGIGSSGIQLQQQNCNNTISILPIGEVITTVAQGTLSDIHSSRSDGSISLSTNSSGLSTLVKMEDLAMVVTNPNSASVNADNEGSLVVDESISVETLTVGSLTQHEAAEAIQGLQALAEQGVLEPGTIEEEQIQVMGSDDQTTLVIDPATLEQLVQPKSEPLEVIEIEEGQLLEDVTASTSIAEADATMLGVSSSSITSECDESRVESSGLQLSAEQLMNLTTGDYLEINGEMYKVEVSTDDNSASGMLTQQVIRIAPASGHLQSS